MKGFFDRYKKVCLFICSLVRSSIHAPHHDSDQPDSGKLKITLSHELGSKQASELVSAAERTSEASSAV